MRITNILAATVIVGGFSIAGSCDDVSQAAPENRDLVSRIESGAVDVITKVRQAATTPITVDTTSDEVWQVAGRGLRPCRFEDSHNCFWDASVRGNGRGTSFVDIEGTVLYLPVA